jgi:hypothetical protein
MKYWCAKKHCFIGNKKVKEFCIRQNFKKGCIHLRERRAK